MNADQRLATTQSFFDNIGHALEALGPKVCNKRMIVMERTEVGAWLIDLTPPKGTVTPLERDQKVDADALFAFDFSDDQFAELLAGNRFELEPLVKSGQIEVQGDLDAIKQVGRIFTVLSQTST